MHVCVHACIHICIHNIIVVLPYTSFRIDEAMSKIERDNHLDKRWTIQCTEYIEADRVIRRVRQLNDISSLKKKAQEMSYLISTRRQFGGTLD